MFCFFCTRTPSSRHSTSTCASSIAEYPAPNSRYRRAGSTYVVHHRPSSPAGHVSTPPAWRTDRNRLVQRRPRRRLRYVHFPSIYSLVRSTPRVAKHGLWGTNRLLISFEVSRCIRTISSLEAFTDSEAMTVIARTLIRIVKAEGLRYDDYWIYLAYLILCVNAALQTVQTPYVYHLVRVRAGVEPLGQGFLENGNAYLRYEFAIIGLFWSILWSVSAHF